MKLLDSFDGFLEREGIASFVRKKHQSLLKDFAGDLNQVGGRTASEGLWKAVCTTAC